jgi:hypothetical protein
MLVRAGAAGGIEVMVLLALYVGPSGPAGGSEKRVGNYGKILP